MPSSCLVAARLGVDCRIEAWLRSQGKELPSLDKALADQPDIVILELGANDALRGVDPAITRSNLATMIAKIQLAQTYDEDGQRHDTLADQLDWHD
jgi:hypothetical protein